MKTLYFDCLSGISGDMVLGSLVDLGADFDELEEISSGAFGVKMSHERVDKKGIVATKITISPEVEPHRTLKEVLKMVDDAPLEPEVRKISGGIFRSIAEAESKIHGEIHFHEVGAIDAMVEVTGSIWALKKLNVCDVYSSSIPLGGLPSPATLELLARRKAPVYSKGVPYELTTPTGAAIITALAKDFIALPPMAIDRGGSGAGSREAEEPNVLRAILSIEQEGKEVKVVEADIDDMNPELYEHLIQLLLEKGAKDVTLTPVHMKKNRLGVHLRVVSPVDGYRDLLEEIFLQTTTLGVRVSSATQVGLRREFTSVKTPWGEVEIKVGKLGDRVVNVAPEYESCRKIALENKIPLKRVYEVAMREALGLGLL
jgi:hypothetical protein